MPSELILENQNLIYSMTKYFYGVELEDLVQAGYLGLMKAYKNYDQSKSNAKFSTYAYGFIYGEMYEVATKNKPIRLNKNELKIYKGVIKTKELLEEKYGRTVPYEEVCSYLHVNFKQFLSILNALSTIEFDEVTTQSRNSSIDDRILLRESLESLSPLEKSVIERRYIDDLSQQETAKVLRLSQVKVSRIEKTSKEKIKNFVSN